MRPRADGVARSRGSDDSAKVLTAASCGITYRWHVIGVFGYVAELDAVWTGE